MFLLVGVLILIAHGAGWLFTLMGALVPAFLAFIVYPIASAIIVPCLYFANPQSSKSIRASIGKWSLGLVVTKEDGDAMSFQEAVVRYWIKVLLAAPTLGATFIMSAFTANKQALHDQLSNTKVTWKGDDERRLYE